MRHFTISPILPFLPHTTALSRLPALHFLAFCLLPVLPFYRFPHSTAITRFSDFKLRPHTALSGSTILRFLTDSPASRTYRFTDPHLPAAPFYRAAALTGFAILPVLTSYRNWRIYHITPYSNYRLYHFNYSTAITGFAILPIYHFTALPPLPVLRFLALLPIRLYYWSCHITISPPLQVLPILPFRRPYLFYSLIVFTTLPNPVAKPNPQG